MMQICPGCGYVDPPYWRDMLFNPRTSIARLEDVENGNPELASRLKQERKLQLGQYMFKLTRQGWIWRKWATHFKVEGWKTKKETFDSSYSKRGKDRSEALHKVMQKINSNANLEKDK